MALRVPLRRVELLAHRQGVLVGSPRPGVVPLGLEQEAQVVQAVGQVGVALRVPLRRVELLAHRQRLFQQPRGGLGSPLLVELDRLLVQLGGAAFQLCPLLRR